jgi:hypothetical protein
MMLMSMWCAILVPFFMIMMVVGGSRRPRPTHDSDEEIEVDSTYQGEEEGMEGDGDKKMTVMVRIPKNQKTGTHPCGSMSLSLLEGKGVEQRNLYVTIVIKIHRFLYPCEKASMWAYVLG